MASEMSIIDKNEYLKKYLSGGKEGKKSKKKKKVKTTQQRSMIIDDDIDISQLNTMKEVEDLFETNEDAPQIVKVTDHTLRLTIEDYRNSNLWKPIGEIDDTNQNEETDSGQHTALTPKVSESDDGGKNKYDDDCSPPRRMKKGSPARKKRSSSPSQSRNNSNSNPLRKMNSPPRRSRGSSPSHSRLNRDSSPPRKTTTNTPPRKAKNKSYYDNGPFPPPSTDNNLSNKSKNKWNNDASPQRKSRKGSEDNSPRRKSKSQHSFDKSSPRRIKRRSPSPDANYGSSRKSNSKMNDDNSPPRKSKVNHEIDSSPLRRVNSPVIRSRWESDDNSPPRRRQDIDSSPPRRIKRENNSPNADNSPPRKFKSRWQSTDNNDIKSQSTSSEGRNSSPPRKKQKEEEIPKPRKLLPGDKKGKYLIPAKRQLEKLTTTLDGKTAGLQNASELTKELQAHRAREDLLYQTISPEALGATAAPIMRDRSTGKVRDLEKEAEELRKKQQKESESREKYTRWGKGLKQVEDYNEQLTQDLHEMQKPLARYADDEDLERHLKEQLREGDPMLAYIKKKRRKENIATGKEIDKPQYEGECLPNRYGIRPGHRWDGVDRSNGYEQKWFEKQNSRKAEQEEIYKWSTEDM